VDELDRVAAAGGVRVVHAAGSTVSRKAWSAALAVFSVRVRGEADDRQRDWTRRAQLILWPGTDPEPTLGPRPSSGCSARVKLPAQEMIWSGRWAEAGDSARVRRPPAER